MRWLLIASLFITSACTTKDQLKKTLADNPDILVNAIQENPVEILEALNAAVEKAKVEMAKKRQQKEEESLEEEFKNPKEVKVADGRVIFGNKDAKITIVEYSDFECPVCSRGYSLLKQIKDEYGDKVRVVYKHLPLRQIHPHAEPAARFYEAIAMQGHDKAEKFHDYLFENQRALQQGESFLKKAAKQVGANVSKLMKDKDSDKVTKLISEDESEAMQLGISGTPGFVINGVTVKGLNRYAHFKMIIDRHLKN